MGRHADPELGNARDWLWKMGLPKGSIGQQPSFLEGTSWSFVGCTLLLDAGLTRQLKEPQYRPYQFLSTPTRRYLEMITKASFYDGFSRLATDSYAKNSIFRALHLCSNTDSGG